MATDIQAGLSAKALWAARLGGGVVEPRKKTLSEAEAYAVQDRLIDSAPHPLAGWKIGATGPGAPKALGLSGPLSGPLWPDAMVASGTIVPVYEAHRPKAEVELAVRFDRAPIAADTHAVHSAIG